MSAEIDFEVDREVLDAYCFIGKAKQFFRLHENPRCRKSKRFHQEYRPLYLYGSYLGELYRDKKIVIALASEGAAEDGIIKIDDKIEKVQIVSLSSTETSFLQNKRIAEKKFSAIYSHINNKEFGGLKNIPLFDLVNDAFNKIQRKLLKENYIEIPTLLAFFEYPAGLEVTEYFFNALERKILESSLSFGANSIEKVYVFSGSGLRKIYSSF